MNKINDKSPGSDGTTAEFYKVFWSDVKEYLPNEKKKINYT